MEYLAVRCRSCEKEFAVERIGTASEVAPFRRPSFKASYTCPHCSATHDYVSDDLTLSAGSIEDNPNVALADHCEVSGGLLASSDQWQSSRRTSREISAESSPTRIPNRLMLMTVPAISTSSFETGQARQPSRRLKAPIQP